MDDSSNKSNPIQMSFLDKSLPEMDERTDSVHIGGILYSPDSEYRFPPLDGKTVWAGGVGDIDIEIAPEDKDHYKGAVIYTGRGLYYDCHERGVPRERLHRGGLFDKIPPEEFNNIHWYKQEFPWFTVPENERRVPSKSQEVYFIEAPRVAMVKIGIADNVKQRLMSLQVGSPVKLRVIATLPGGLELEQELHRQFGHLRSHGEWFHLTDEIHAYISKIKKGVDND